MTQPNPYDPPRTTTTPDTRLADKSRRLLERRDEPVTVVGFLRGQWRRHFLIAFCLSLLGVLSWRVGNTYLPVGLAAFWAGQIVRDIQWYRTVVVEWESTKELLDWEKIKRLAA